MDKVATALKLEVGRQKEKGRVALRLVTAMLISGCAIGLVVLFEPYFERASFLLPFAAVCLSAWIGGSYGGSLLGGTIALTLSAGLLLLFVLPPWQEFIRQPVHMIPMACFVAGSFIATFVLGHLQATTRKLRENIAERKLTERALQQSEAKFRTLFEKSIDAIGVSHQGKHVFVNPAYLQLYGYEKPADVLGRPVLDVLAPSVRAEVADRIERRARGEVVPSKYETRGLRRDGTEFDFEVNVSAFDFDGSPHTLVIVRDITRRKAAQRELETRARQQETIAALGQKALSAPISSLYQHTALIVQQTLGVSQVLLLDILAGGRELLLRAAAGWPTEDTECPKTQDSRLKTQSSGPSASSAPPGTSAPPEGLRVDSSVRFFPGYVLSCKSPVSVANFPSDERFEPGFLAGRGIVSAAAVAIRSAESSLGVLCAFTDRPHRFSLNDLYFLQAVAYVLSAAVERQRAEAGLQEREFLLRRVLDTNPTLILVKDRDGTILLANEAMAATYGAKLEDVIGQSHTALHKRWNMSLEEVDHWLRDDRQVIDTGLPKDLIEPFTHRDGSLHWYRCRKLPLDCPSAKTPHTSTKTVPEAQDTKASTKRPPAVPSPGAAETKSLAVQNSELGQGEGLSNAVGSLNPSGPSGRTVLIVAADITEQKNAADQIRQLNAHLERRVLERTSELAQANEELEAFSYSISHDLRSPLRAIDGFAQMIREDHAAELSTEALRLFEVISSNAQRMGDLIDDLLQFSRLSRAELQPVLVDMTALTESVVEQLRALEPARKVDIHIQPLPPAMGDTAMLRQVLVNLISNALKFTRNNNAPLEAQCPSGRTSKLQTISIAAHVNNDCPSGQWPPPAGGASVKNRSKPQWAVYSVADNGVGFDPRYSHKLFQVFQRLHRAEDFEGTGVGLAIVQRVVHRHGGRVWADGNLNQGATFYFSLPTAVDVEKLDKLSTK